MSLAPGLSQNNTVLSEQALPGVYFPRQYVIDFFRFLQCNQHIIETISFDDFAWGDDYDYQNGYGDEYARWQAELKNVKRDKNKIYVAIQHDVDDAPERTLALLKEEERLGLRSNVMIFNRRIDRVQLLASGTAAFSGYELDDDYLRVLSTEKGFAIGYHSNAFEQAQFDYEKAIGIFESDIAALRQRFDVRYFSPHGGVSSPDGKTNSCLPIPDSLKQDLRWVHNTYSPSFNGYFSDGGINLGRRDPESFSLANFVKSWKRGKRYRVLLHPQYYDDPCTPASTLRGTPWYDTVLRVYTGLPAERQTIVDRIVNRLNHTTDVWETLKPQWQK